MTTERKSGRTWVWIRKRERGPFSWPGAAGGGGWWDDSCTPGGSPFLKEPRTN